MPRKEKNLRVQRHEQTVAQSAPLPQTTLRYLRRNSFLPSSEFTRWNTKALAMANLHFWSGQWLHDWFRFAFVHNDGNGSGSVRAMIYVEDDGHRTRDMIGGMNGELSVLLSCMGGSRPALVASLWFRLAIENAHGPLREPLLMALQLLGPRLGLGRYLVSPAGE